MCSVEVSGGWGGMLTLSLGVCEDAGGGKETGGVAGTTEEGRDIGG